MSTRKLGRFKYDAIKSKITTEDKNTQNCAGKMLINDKKVVSTTKRTTQIEFISSPWWHDIKGESKRLDLLDLINCIAMGKKSEKIQTIKFGEAVT